MSEAQVGTIHDLLAECIACAGVFDVSTDYEADKADLENATQAVLDHVQTLRDERDRLREALQGILDIGKRDMTNPKYDGYFEAAEAALAPAGEYGGATK